MNKVWRVLTKIFLSLLFIAAILYGLWFFYLTYKPFPQKFNSEQWKKANPIKDTVRFSMVKDLFVRYKLIGMSQEEIINLLGPDEDSDPKQWVYWLGNGTSRFGPDFLILKINSHQVVENYELKSD